MRSTPQSRLPLVGVIVLAGCVTAPPLQGQVGVQEVDSAVPAETRMTLADNELFIRPLPSADNDMPQYPTNMLVHRLPPQAVCLRVSIDSAGSVLSTSPVVQTPHCPGQETVDAAFFASAAQATAGWHFEPALRCVFPDVQTRENTYGSCGGFPETAEAVSLTYRFVFEQKDGRGSVRMSQ